MFSSLLECGGECVYFFKGVGGFSECVACLCKGVLGVGGCDDGVDGFLDDGAVLRRMRDAGSSVESGYHCLLVFSEMCLDERFEVCAAKMAYETVAVLCMALEAAVTVGVLAEFEAADRALNQGLPLSCWLFCLLVHELCRVADSS